MAEIMGKVTHCLQSMVMAWWAEKGSITHQLLICNETAWQRKKGAFTHILLVMGWDEMTAWQKKQHFHSLSVSH